MQPLQIEISKRGDGAGVLACLRHDGSRTWQKQTVRAAAHFAHHDLTHYAVETTLGYQRGFFGLIAEGWEIEDTTGKGSRGPLPAEALEVEHIVGLFDRQRSTGLIWSVEDFNTYSMRPLSDQQIQAVLKARAELFHRWANTEPGTKLALTFPASPATLKLPKSSAPHTGRATMRD